MSLVIDLIGQLNCHVAVNSFRAVTYSLIIKLDHYFGLPLMQSHI